MIKEGDEIYRIGQLNNSRYGEGLVFNKLTQNIEEITEKGDYETVAQRLKPKFTGLHTVSLTMKT